jgi:hypothetical protein
MSKRGGDAKSTVNSYCVAMREHIPVLRHDLGADAANESAEMFVFLMNIDRLYYDDIT